MSVIRTTPGKLQGLIRRRFERSKVATRRGALAAAHRGKTMIGHHTPQDLGQLVLSWDVKKPAKGGRTIAELVNDAPHAGIVELGARPHKVSAEGWAAIYEWVERHFPDARDDEGEVDAYGNDPEVSRITWAIVNKIRREGQKPTYFVSDRMPDFLKIANEEINHQFRKLAAKGKL